MFQLSMQKVRESGYKPSPVNPTVKKELLVKRCCCRCCHVWNACYHPTLYGPKVHAFGVPCTVCVCVCGFCKKYHRRMRMEHQGQIPSGLEKCHALLETTFCHAFFCEFKSSIGTIRITEKNPVIVYRQWAILTENAIIIHRNLSWHSSSINLK